ncbi:hypothetical protein [Pseudomonas fluorescens]|jgi:hypothetical protein
MTPFRDSHQDLLRALASFPGAEGDAFQAALHTELLMPFLNEAQALLTLCETSEQQLQAAARSLEAIVDQHVYRINE